MKEALELITWGGFKHSGLASTLMDLKVLAGQLLVLPQRQMVVPLMKKMLNPKTITDQVRNLLLSMTTTWLNGILKSLRELSKLEKVRKHLLLSDMELSKSLELLIETLRKWVKYRQLRELQVEALSHNSHL